MSLAGLLNQTVSIQRMSPSDDEDDSGDHPLEPDGEPVESRGRLQKLEIGPGEFTVGRDTSVTDWMLYLPAGVAIDHQDVVTVDGQAYSVLGTPYPVQTPIGTHHIQARVRAVAD
jgi:hypothetical protein